MLFGLASIKNACPPPPANGPARPSCTGRAGGRPVIIKGRDLQAHRPQLDAYLLNDARNDAVNVVEIRHTEFGDPNRLEGDGDGKVCEGLP